MDTDGLDIVNWNVWADEEGLGRWTRKDKMGSMCMDIGRELERLGMRSKTVKEVGICLGRIKGNVGRYGSICTRI